MFEDQTELETITQQENHRHHISRPALLKPLRGTSVRPNPLPADALTDCLPGRDRRPELTDLRQHLLVRGMLRGGAGHRGGVSSRPRRRQQRRGFRRVLGELVRLGLGLVRRCQG